MSEKKEYGAPVFAELGRNGLRQSGGYVYEEFLRKLQWPKAGDIYQEMSSNDPVITAVIITAILGSLFVRTHTTLIHNFVPGKSIREIRSNLVNKISPGFAHIMHAALYELSTLDISGII